MRRTVMLGAVWLLAAAVAVFVAWQGVAVVGDQVTDERPAPLAAGDIEERLAEASSITTTTTTGQGSASTSSSTTNTTSTNNTTSTTSTTTAVRDASTTTAATPTEPTPAPSTTTVAGETRTYNLQGGTASLRFGPAGVEVVFANPAAGFSVEIEPEHGNGVKVEFESDDHRSRVDGWWDGGPVDRVREESDD